MNEHHAARFCTCLDVVASERRTLAQIEAPPLERFEGFMGESVTNDQEAAKQRAMRFDGGYHDSLLTRLLKGAV